MGKFQNKRTPHSVDDAEIWDNARKKYPHDRESAERLATFATTFNRILTEREIDQNLLAADIGVSVGAISNYRNALAEPKLISLIKIADHLGVDCNYLMTGIRSEHKSLSEYIGLDESSINNLHTLTDNKERERKTGWLSESEMHLASINAMLGAGFDQELFRLIYHYLFGKITHFGILPRNAHNDSEEVFDTDLSIYGRQHEMTDTQEILNMNVSEMEDILLVKIEARLRKLKSMIVK